MFETILGIIITIIPFILIFAFKNRLLGFVWISSSVVSFHLCLALLTQAFHVFTYPIILSINCILALAVLFYFFKKKINIKLDLPKLSTLLIFLIIIFNLVSVHYLYTGKVNTLNGQREVKNSVNVFPYFSDEWSAVALAKYSIENKSLPNVNPLYKDTPFPNPMFPYFSFISEIFLLTKTDPLTAFVPLSIFFSTLLCGIVFLFLRRLGLSNIATTLAVLSLPYITVGANLPGLWHLLPMTFGIIFFLLCLISMLERNNKLIAFTALLSVVFYPPMIVFTLPSLVGLFVMRKEIFSKKALYYSLGFIIVALISFIFISSDMKDTGVWQKLSSLLFRDNLEPGIPAFKAEYVLPIWTLVLSVIGLFVFVQKKIFYITYPLFVGLVFWIAYMFTRVVFLIDYPRVVVITSILLTIISAYGLDFIIEKLKWQKKENGLMYLLIIIFIFSSFYYTQRDSWQKLVLIVKTDGKVTQVKPAPPANTYLIKDDLQIFSGLTEKIFLAPAWKGLSIGASTGNFPLQSKSSTITNNIYSFDTFTDLDCKGKVQAMEKYKIDYIYSKQIDCREFTGTATSSEGFVLYRLQ